MFQINVTDTIILPDECVGPDSALFRRFAQQHLGIDSKALFATLTSEDVPCVPRSSLELKYRGHQLNRTKFFLVDTLDPLPVYNYTGFQYASTRFYKTLDTVPAVRALNDQVNAIKITCDSGATWKTPGSNHVIGTKYLSATDSIGYHMDKTKSFEPDSYILLLSLGADREFHLCNNETKEVTPFVVKDGDLFVLGWETNKTFKHALVPFAEETILDKHRDASPRMSLCFRNIKEKWPAPKLAKKLAACAKSKSVRDQAKQKRKRLSSVDNNEEDDVEDVFAPLKKKSKTDV
jgi:alkylated DNA repair dioxygenase AlkB